MSAPTLCPVCNLPVATTDEVIAGQATYADSLGGHADRHILVIETADALIEGARP